LGNIRSVSKALEKAGAYVKVTADSKEIVKAEGVVLPGVGAFERGARNLLTLSLTSLLPRLIREGKAFLGICLGLQLLFERSEESREWKGLGVLKGEVRRFEPCEGLKVPHMGWNKIKVKKRKEKGMFTGVLEEEAYFYFVHSYYVIPQEEDIVLATADYGKEFVCAVAKGRLWGVQFHPEKSGKVGLEVLKNFLSLC